MLICVTLFFSIRAEYKVVGYYTNASIYQKIDGVKRFPACTPLQIPGKKLTHLNYAFLGVEKDGSISLTDSWADVGHTLSSKSTRTPFNGNLAELQTFKKRYPHVKVLISVGGGNNSHNFSLVAADKKKRAVFVKSIIDFLTTYKLDGVDIDWEYPGMKPPKGSPHDGKNFTLLLQELRAALTKKNSDYLLTVALPIAPRYYKKIELDKLAQYIDWVNLMTYNFSIPQTGNHRANHNAPLYCRFYGGSIQSVIDDYISRGMPAEKILLGVPFYGHRFTDTDGLLCAYNKPTEQTSLYFANVRNKLADSHVRGWDPVARVPYLYHPEKKEFISYDDQQSIKEKISFVKKQKLGGVMIWELCGDSHPEWELLSLIAGQLK